MAGYSFQDDLARLHAANANEQEQAERRAGFARMQEYRAGEGAAADIIGRVATYGRDAASSAVTLRQAATHQPKGLAGNVAAGALSERASEYQRQAQANAELEQLRAQAQAANDAARQAHHERAARADRTWYREREIF